MIVNMQQELTFHAIRLKIKQRQKVSLRWPKGPDTKWLDCPTTLSGILTPRRNEVIWGVDLRTERM